MSSSFHRSPEHRAPVASLRDTEITGVHRREASRRHIGEQALAIVDEVERGQITKTLLLEAGFNKVLPVRGIDRPVNVEYDPAAQEQLLQAYQDWMAPTLKKIESAIDRWADALEERTGQPPDLDDPDLVALVNDVKKSVTDALHRPLRNPFEASGDDDRWLPPLAEGVAPRIRVQIEAMRAVLSRRSDWLEYVDEAVRNMTRSEDVRHAWAKITDRSPSWVQALHRLMGIAGIEARTLTRAECDARGLATATGALISGAGEKNDADLSSHARLAYMEGADLRERFQGSLRKQGEIMTDLRGLRDALRELIAERSQTGNLIAIPNVLEWKEEVQALAQRILNLETRRQQIATMEMREIDAPDTLDRMRASYDALSEEAADLSPKLRKGQELYRRIGAHLDGLTKDGVVLSSRQSIGAEELLSLVEGRLRFSTGAKPGGQVTAARA